MNDVIEYDQDNQFITVGSGVTLAALQEKLAEANQWLPLRPPFFKADSTTGSIAAMAAVGPERLLYGAPRDMLLGLQYIDSGGNMVAAGGKVVKNVAGYDMTRLLTGSLGTLGFITETTWKTATRPQSCRMTTAAGSLEACFATAVKIVNSNLMAAFITMAPAGDSWKLMVGFEGLEIVVDSQVGRCADVMTSNGLADNAQSEYPVVEGALGEVFDAVWQSAFVMQADVVIENGADCIREMEKIVQPSHLLLDVAGGRIYAGLEALTAEQWKKLDGLFVRCQGHGRLIKAPEGFARENDMFGSFRPEWRLSHLIKKALDPDTIFSPGTLPGRV